MKTPFTSKGDMVSEVQTAKHYIETLAHHSYSIGFTEGCRYCEKVIYERVLEIIDKTDAKSDNTSAFDFGITQACSEIREAVLAFKGGK